VKKKLLAFITIVSVAIAGCQGKPTTETPDKGDVPAKAAARPGALSSADPHAGMNMKVNEIPAGSGKKAKVTQTMNSGGYTYVEASDEKEGKTWLALPETKVSVGDTIEYPDGPAVSDFHSKTLNRTFPKILFLSSIRVVK